MKSVGDMELMTLRGILRGGDPGVTAHYEGDGLYHQFDDEGGAAVTRVMPEFIAELAALTPGQVEGMAVRWHRCESMADWEPGPVAEMLGEMVEFARRAGREGKPVLQLTTW